MQKYEKDVFCKEFSSKVLSCIGKDEFFEIELEDTIFYPEGGGQPCDLGLLGDSAVREVYHKEGKVLHLCTKSLEVGSEVLGKIDWARRFSFMQEHSGEHIVSGLAHQLFGCDNVGFHMGNEAITIDFNVELSAEQVETLESRANEYIWENHPVEITYPTEKELDLLDYRSKKELSGDVRIVAFPGADCCACCGTHVNYSGQVGLVVFLSCQKFRSGVRLELLCGSRGFEYLKKIQDENGEISRKLSAKVLETSSAVKRLLSEKEMLAVERMNLEKKYIAVLVKSYENCDNVILFVKETSSEGLRLLTVALSHAVLGVAFCFTSSENGFRYGIASQKQDVRPFAQGLKESFHGRGGGKPNLVQGTVSGTEKDLREFLGSMISF